MAGGNVKRVGQTAAKTAGATRASLFPALSRIEAAHPRGSPTRLTPSMLTVSRMLTLRSRWMLSTFANDDFMTPSKHVYTFCASQNTSKLWSMSLLDTVGPRQYAMSMLVLFGNQFRFEPAQVIESWCGGVDSERKRRA